MQTLLVGLDAACFPVLRPLFEDDELPHLESLFEAGAAAELESQIPPWTASAWPSLYTGANPGKHGVFDFLRFEGYDWDIVNATDVRQRTLWEYADEAGLTSVVVNAPVTSPPPEIDGAVIPGYLASEDPTCHPDGVLNDVRDAIGEYRVYARNETDERAGDEKFEEYLELTRLRGEAFRHLSDRFDPDFGFVQFQKTDAVFHDFPGDQEKVRQVYRAVDEQVGAILDACDPDAVVVASDHGMGEYDGSEVRLNRHLRDEGWLDTTTDGRGVPSWFQIKDERLTESDEADGGAPVLERLAGAAAGVGLTYQRGKAVLERLGLAEFVGKHVPVGAVFAASEAVDFTASQAYLRSPSELGVRLNVAGRDPDGVVDPDEYERVRDELIALLETVTAPDGTPVFEEVVPREAYIHGPYAEDAVDVIAVPTDFQHSLSAVVGDPFGDPEPYNHKRDGVVALSGDGVDAEADLSGAHLFDVAPTVLAALDIAPAEVMDGDALPAVDAPETASYDEYAATEQTATEDDEVARRLSDLGYLE
ncbi:Predicted phosphohydrolase or phosphomutase, AlkP superfamily [Natronoarchaeum philippinense]|uniref:Predicted phosphohydrolase or phosphomutase, AlkP superfamily n=1 Tax=Natronoarchaeum philippinense TaxID=558529 RepID=A0A285NCU6_NATPI|nr:alkaline phosphatase family protein [Natronoarchaeum philippinense]SNZ06757.1 Predicted phosphohydrolase or phosphomutase, AlkP superfamily [Natronoarchaeum philippinense]